MNKEYYELRYIETSAVESRTFSLFDDIEDRRTLLDFITQYDKIFLLGNPGIGKTTELKYVFKEIWENIDEQQLVPIHLNIKTFRITSKLEDLIQVQNWQDLPSIVLIFDGLDEIANIHDFISELENFILKYNALNIKYIISCRTNIYEKYLIEIENFEKVYLKYLSINQIKSILKKKYGLEISDNEIGNLESVMQTPFNLDLFAEYHLENENFPSTLEESMELFTSSEARRTREKLIKRFSVTESQILAACRKVAISAELMQRNSISETELYQILGDKGISIFQELPFIEIQESKQDFNFRHKNYQEYFAAKYIADLEIQAIIKLIAANGLQKVKPALFNTVTFLLNIIKGDKFDFLREWLLQNDIEVLFFADENRLSNDLQNNIFEMYYHDQCIDKTFWLKNNSKIKMDTLARFANFNFLIQEIQLKERLERSRISLLEVLSYKVITPEEQETLKGVFLDLIKEESPFFKSEILRAIKVAKLHLNDSAFWGKILSVVKDEKDNDITHQLISILSNIPEDERDNKLVLKIISKHFNPQENHVIRGTEQIVGNIILQTLDPIFFLDLIKMLFDDSKSLRIDSIYSLNFKENLAEKIENYSRNSVFKDAFLEFCFSNEVRLFNQEDFLSVILQSIGISDKEMLDLIRLQNIQQNSLYTLSRFFTSTSIKAIVNAYSSGVLHFIDYKNIQSIRNWMSHSDRRLALQWQGNFLETGYQFSELLYTDEQIKESQDKFEIFKKRNFEILFAKEEFKKEIFNFFTSNKIEKLEQKDFEKIRGSWYEKTGYHGSYNSVHALIERAFRNEKELKAEDAIKYLDDNYFFLSVTKAILGHNSANSLVIQPDEKHFLQELSSDLESQIDYDVVVKYHPEDQDRFSTTINYEYIKLLLFFDINFNIHRSDIFYLNILEYGNITRNSVNEDTNFVDFIKLRMVDNEELDDKVIINIKEKKLLYPAKKAHFEYAIANNLSQCFSVIGQQMAEEDYLTFDGNLLKSFLQKINKPKEYLRTFCSDVSSHICWKAIKLLQENYLDSEFCLEVARKYFETENSDYIHKAVNILFHLNQPDALHYYVKMLDKMTSIEHGDSSGYLPSDMSNYNHLTELEFIEPLFYKIFVDSKVSFYLHHSREFLRVLITKLGNSDEGYNSIKQILIKIKSEVNDKESQAFYINHLIEILENSYLKENSKEFSIKDIIEILE